MSAIIIIKHLFQCQAKGKGLEGLQESHLLLPHACLVLANLFKKSGKMPRNNDMQEQKWMLMHTEKTLEEAKHMSHRKN